MADTHTLEIQAPASFRMVLVSFLSAAIGLLAGLVAFALYKLIGLVAPEAKKAMPSSWQSRSACAISMCSSSLSRW